MIKPLFKAGQEEFADLADKESCSPLGSGGGPESSGRILGLLFSKIKKPQHVSNLIFSHQSM